MIFLRSKSGKNQGKFSWNYWQWIKRHTLVFHFLSISSLFWKFSQLNALCRVEQGVEQLCKCLHEMTASARGLQLAVPDELYLSSPTTQLWFSLQVNYLQPHMKSRENWHWGKKSCLTLKSLQLRRASTIQQFFHGLQKTLKWNISNIYIYNTLLRTKSNNSFPSQTFSDLVLSRTDSWQREDL